MTDIILDKESFEKPIWAIYAINDDTKKWKPVKFIVSLSLSLSLSNHIFLQVSRLLNCLHE